MPFVWLSARIDLLLSLHTSFVKSDYPGVRRGKWSCLLKDFAFVMVLKCRGWVGEGVAGVGEGGGGELIGGKGVIRRG